jgi:cobalt/nickel transport system ATP-binding protein
MSHHIVEMKNVSYEYPDGTKALSDISFRIIHGESVGVVGPNGAGKTTMIMLLNGQLLAGSGSVLIGEIPVTKKNRQEVRRSVGIVLQNPDDQLFMPTVFDDVGFGPINLGLSEAAVRRRIDEALEEVGCSDLISRPPHRLSGGQKKSVAIAGVIAMKPDVLVMDEPSANLDPKSRRQLIDILKQFKHSRIIASHDLDLILEVCDRCIVLHNGSIMADGVSEMILLDEVLMERSDLELPVSVTFQRRNERWRKDSE